MTESEHGKKWSREHTRAALVLYMHLPPDQLEKRNKAVISFAEAIGRTPASVAFKLRNIQFCDPNKKRVGNSHASQEERDLWDDYNQDSDKLISEAVEYYLKYTESLKQPIVFDSDIDITTTPEGQDVVTVTTRRLHQDYFRNSLLQLYDGKCCVTGLDIPQLLVASHIKPWNESDPFKERVNVENGLLLNSLHDKAFDCGLITLSNDYKIVFSEELEEYCAKDNEATSCWLRLTRGRRIVIKEERKPNLEFIEYHREHVFRG